MNQQEAEQASGNIEKNLLKIVLFQKLWQLPNLMWHIQ